jgi:hypothetical protein
MEPYTPFPSPTIQANSLPSSSLSDASTASDIPFRALRRSQCMASIQNIGTPFHALRRSQSYQAEIASAVSSIFDATSDSSRHSSHGCVQPCESNATHMDLSHLLSITLDPLFERVFLIRNKPKTSDGVETTLQCGAYIHNNIDDYTWKIFGIHISLQNEIAIYRAYNDSSFTSVFIITPIEWSNEGLQFNLD